MECNFKSRVESFQQLIMKTPSLKHQLKERGSSLSDFGLFFQPIRESF